mmetsp:Transcript_4184/g.7095  ORF Transcript_4184/g.7095 Transcript_4184/m.7095 type:complete len:142 (-) Transcript_4184:537-962(-)
MPFEGEAAQNVCDSVASQLEMDGFSSLAFRDGYFYTSPKENQALAEDAPAEDEEEAPLMKNAKVGDLRVQFREVCCSEVTILAQQITDIDNGDRITFRAWNPSKRYAAWGEDVSSDTDVSCPSFCVCCVAVGWCFKAVFQE